MSNAAATMRADLVAALDPVLPGRVQPYRPASLAASVAPVIWVDDHQGGWRTLEGAAGVQTWFVAAPLWVVVDGANHASQALYDELLCKAFDALMAAGFDVDDWAPASFDADPDTTLRAAVITVARPMFTPTLCQPDPAEQAELPPQPVEV
jgi:hypothetical protein